MDIPTGYKFARSFLNIATALGVVGCFAFPFIFPNPTGIGLCLGSFISIGISYIVVQAIFDISDCLYFTARQNQAIINKLNEMSTQGQPAEVTEGLSDEKPEA